MSDAANEPTGESPPDDPKLTEESSAPKRHERSSKERVLVWGGIGLLLLLVAFQAHARFGYEWTLDAVQKRLAEDDGPNPRQLMLSEVPPLIVGWPAQETIDDAERPNAKALKLSWIGLGSSYEMSLPYDPGDRAILGVTTKDAPDTAAPPPASNADRGAEPPGLTGDTASPTGTAEPASPDRPASEDSGDESEDENEAESDQ
ncbi:MAG: hypothetical protein DWQ29_22835 [Planctomycetota bacterium]|nr:MAG: hypothetical protein DWQ29_22835 [Planctomycetota bacterium]